MKQFAVFGFGIGNFSGNHRPKRGWQLALNAELRKQAAPMAVSAQYGHSGNFIVQASASPDTVRREMSTALSSVILTISPRPQTLGRSSGDASKCAVMALSDLRSLLITTRQMAIRKSTGKLRYTPGAVLPVSGQSGSFRRWRTDRGSYLAFRKGVVLAVKHDCLRANGTLDPHRRKGGWGGLSDDVVKMMGGDWTARSRRTLEGLLRCASDAAHTDQ